MSIEIKIKDIFKQVLDIKPDEIKENEKLDIALGIDSTEMVELTVAIKKAFNLVIPNNQFKKTQTFNELVAFVKSQGVQ
ncbi:MAG: acyl carrier protein [Candidatus Omnitrophica bacterium]|nr:acyl carrier protein [Candidatus Omnitrophota bacterium]